MKNCCVSIFSLTYLTTSAHLNIITLGWRVPRHVVSHSKNIFEEKFLNREQRARDVKGGHRAFVRVAEISGK